MMKYLALGDSIADGEKAFPAFLAEQLPHLEYVNLARGGSRIPDLFADQLPAAVAALMRKDVKLITLVIGANDVLSVARERFENEEGPVSTLLDQTKLDVQMMAHNYEALLSILRTVAGPDVHIVVLTYYNPYPDDDYVMRDLATYMLEDSETGINAVIRNLAAQANAQVVDTAWPMLDLVHPTITGDVTIPLTDLETGEPILDEEDKPKTITVFDVHPNEHGHRNIADEVYGALEAETMGVIAA